MQGKRRFEPKLFYNLSLNELVPGGHLLRRFDPLHFIGFSL